MKSKASRRHSCSPQIATLEYRNNRRKDTSRRRIFIEKQGSNVQLLSFNQHKDGSIYTSMPEFPNIKRMTIIRLGDNVGLAMVDPLALDGKLNIHGTGRPPIKHIPSRTNTD